MSNITEKTSSNVFYKARCTASTHNPALTSREGAADSLAIDRCRLYRIECGKVKPYPEEVFRMTKLYNAPELKNFYCCQMCPLGYDVPQIKLEDLNRLSVRMLSTFRNLKSTESMLLDVTEDGLVDQSEQETIKKIVDNLEEVESISQGLKVWMKRNLKGNTRHVSCSKF
jgi:hypothetical protein